MFKSARVKLTLFYLAAIVIISLFLTIGVRSLAQRAFDNSSADQQGGFQELIRREIGLPIPNRPYNSLREQEDAKVHHQLNEYVIEINILALVVGGIASYWYAGRALRPIEEAHEAQARFASDASHELRTPLTVMKTENEVFLRQPKISEKDARNQIESNLEEIQRLENLASNLLALANYEQGERLELGIIKASSVSKLATSQIKKLHKKDIKRLVVDIEDMKIYGHAESLAQVITIFVDNAIKYGPSDKPINIIGLNDGDAYRFMVEDSGPGVDPEDMPLIFERLFRGDKNRSRTVPGHGLGLALAMEIAKANGAGLSVSNRSPRGARFTLTVQLHQP